MKSPLEEERKTSVHSHWEKLGDNLLTRECNQKQQHVLLTEKRDKAVKATSFATQTEEEEKQNKTKNLNYR